MVDFAALAAPFPPDEIDWRVGSTTQDKKRGMALAYIDARTVMDRLDAVCGPGGWQCRYPHAGAKTCCEIGVKVGEEWVWRSDGAGDTDFEGDKGAFSDSFKRAAVRFGIGRYLYGMGSPWVAIEPAGKSYKIADNELPRLRALLTKGGAPTQPEPKAEAAKTPRDLAYEYGNGVIKQVNTMKTEAFLNEYLAAEAKKKPWLDMAVNHPDLLEIVRKAVKGKRIDLNDGKDVAA